MSNTTKARQATSRKVAGMAIPECFAEATVAAHENIRGRTRSQRRAGDARDMRRVRDQARRARRVAG